MVDPAGPKKLVGAGRHQRGRVGADEGGGDWGGQELTLSALEAALKLLESAVVAPAANVTAVSVTGYGVQSALTQGIWVSDFGLLLAVGAVRDEEGEGVGLGAALEVLGSTFAEVQDRPPREFEGRCR